ncbi:O-antigen polymerase [Comamonadaceae bacterium PP-2]
MNIELIFSLFFVAISIVVSLRKFGIWSPQFLVVIHFALAVPMRALFLMNFPDASEYLLNPILFYYNFDLVVILLSGSCLLFVFLSCFFNKRPSLSRELTLAREFNVRHLFLFAVIVFLIYLYLAASIFGGISNAILGFLSRTVDALEGFSYVTILSDVFVVASLSIFYSASVNRKRVHYFLALLLVILALMLLMASGGRGNLIQYILSLCILYFGIRGKLSKKAVFVLSLSALVVVSAIFAGLAARKSVQNKTDFTVELADAAQSALPTLSAPFALLDHYNLSTIYVERNGFDYGTQFANFILKPIPRLLWPEKPNPIAIEMRITFFGDSLGGIPPGLFGEMYIAFGWFALLITPIFMVICISMISYLMRLQQFRGYSCLVYAILVPYFAFNLMRGGIDIGLMRILIVLFSIYLVILATSKKKRNENFTSNPLVYEKSRRAL